MNFYITLIGGVTLASISLYRAVMLKNPFLLRAISDFKIRRGIACLWIISCIMPLTSLLLESIIFYDPGEMSCTSTLYATPNFGLYILFFLLFLLPMCVIFISNIAMLVVSIKYRRRMAEITSSGEERNMAAVTLLTVTCVCWLFLISWLPWIIKIFFRAYGSNLPVWYSIFQQHVLTLNVVLNPVIYTLTNQSFKEVVKKRVLGPVQSVFCRVTGGGTGTNLQMPKL